MAEGAANADPGQVLTSWRLKELEGVGGVGA